MYNKKSWYFGYFQRLMHGLIDSTVGWVLTHYTIEYAQYLFADINNDIICKYKHTENEWEMPTQRTAYSPEFPYSRGHANVYQINGKTQLKFLPFYSNTLHSIWGANHPMIPIQENPKNLFDRSKCPHMWMRNCIIHCSGIALYKTDSLASTHLYLTNHERYTCISIWF